MTVNDVIQKTGFTAATVTRDKVNKTFPANTPEQTAQAFQEISKLFRAVSEKEFDSPIFVNDLEIKSNSHFDTDKAKWFNYINFQCVFSDVPF